MALARLGRDAQRADQDAMQAVANVLNDKKLMAELANRRAQLAMLISDFQTQEAIARTAIELANDAADVELRLKSQRVLSAALAGKGDTHAALELTRSGLSQAREQGLRRLKARTCPTSQICCSIRGKSSHRWS